MALTECSYDDLLAEWEIIEDFTEDLVPADDYFEPELSSPSGIFDMEDCRKLLAFLPARCQISPWKLIYSTNNDGFGINNLYRKASELSSPTILAIKDYENHVFGAITSCPPQNRYRFEGNGECCVFSCFPDQKVYSWNGCDFNILCGDGNGISVGSSNGNSALWLDSDLYRGRTSACSTFQNDMLCSCGDFLAKTVELWTF